MTITTNLGGSSQFKTQRASNQKTVFIAFDAAVSSATIDFRHTRGATGPLRRNDGFGLDDIAVSAVPVPASVLMLGAGIAALGAMRRRSRKS